MSRERHTNIPLAVASMVLAWIVPGAGHVYIGRPVRGIIVGLVIAATFWAGVAMGGVMTVEPRYEPWWFVADLLAGAHGVAAWQIEEHAWRSLADDPDVRRQQTALRQDPVDAAAVMDATLQAHGLALTSPTDVVARAYCGIAGLLNLMCIFDVMMLALMGVRSEPPRPAKGAHPQGVLS